MQEDRPEQAAQQATEGDDDPPYPLDLMATGLVEHEILHGNTPLFQPGSTGTRLRVNSPLACSHSQTGRTKTSIFFSPQETPRRTGRGTKRPTTDSGRRDEPHLTFSDPHAARKDSWMSTWVSCSASRASRYASVVLPPGGPGAQAARARARSIRGIKVSRWRSRRTIALARRPNAPRSIRPSRICRNIPANAPAVRGAFRQW